MKIRTTEEYDLIASNMQEYGNSFFRYIGKALAVADDVHRQKLADKFAKDFAMYEQLEMEKI